MTDETEDDFKALMVADGVSPLPEGEVRVPLQAGHLDDDAQSLHNRRMGAATHVLSLSAPRLGSVGPSDVMAWKRQDVRSRVYRRLQDGLIPIDVVEDLHSLTEERLRIRLPELIRSWGEGGVNVGLLIHGKAREAGSAPVLKNRLYQWLPDIAQVAAFHSALPKDGGTGAVYVLLQK